MRAHKRAVVEVGSKHLGCTTLAPSAATLTPPLQASNTTPATPCNQSHYLLPLDHPWEAPEKAVSQLHRLHHVNIKLLGQRNRTHACKMGWVLVFVLMLCVEWEVEGRGAEAQHTAFQHTTCRVAWQYTTSCTPLPLHDCTMRCAVCSETYTTDWPTDSP